MEKYFMCAFSIHYIYLSISYRILVLQYYIIKNNPYLYAKIENFDYSDFYFASAWIQISVQFY